MTPQQTKALIIGDSISIGYAPLVAEGLQASFRAVRNEGNAGDSARGRP